LRNNSKTKDLLAAAKELRAADPPFFILELSSDLKQKGFNLELIPKAGDYSEYFDYVKENKDSLGPESEYIRKVLEAGESWGEILIARNKQGKIVGTLGPNRTEKDENGEMRARPGYFSVLPEFRNRGIGTILFWRGMEIMREMGADHIKVSVERDNLSAIRVYQNCGMELTEKRKEAK